MGRVAAIFDLDETLLDAATPNLILRYMRRTGELWRYFRRRDMIVVVGALLQHRVGLMNAGEAVQATARISAGIRLDEFWPLVDRWFREMVIHTITEEGAARLDWHRNQGHIPVICSASSQFSVMPVARHLDVEHTVYTEWLSADGQLTGRVRLPIVYGEDKRRQMEKWAAVHEVDLSHSYAYGNDITDHYLLEAVAHPMAVNPSKKLATHAQANGWPVARWSRLRTVDKQD